jgi:hypothetical protein
LADRTFDFELNLTDAGRRHAMLGELTSRLLGFIGYQENAAASILGHVQAALATALAEGCPDCTLHFQVASGQLDVVISRQDGREWRTTRVLP